MRKKGEVVLVVVFAVLIGACHTIPPSSVVSMSAQNIATTNTSPLIPDTASPVPMDTSTISAAFLALLATEPPRVSPTYATPIPVIGTPQPLTQETIIAEEEAAIKKVIQKYFDRRYAAFSLSNQDGIPDTFFDDLLFGAPETSDFAALELAKLRMNLRHFELNHLKYAAYEYFLTYENIAVEPISQRATIILSKSENFISEISAMLAAGEPIISSGSGEKHSFVLHKEEGEWKIVSDTYNDYVWRMLGNTSASTEETLNTLDSMMQNLKASPRPASMNCFRENFSSPFIVYDVEDGYPSNAISPSANFPVHPGIAQVYLNGKRYDPEWPYSAPFINLYFQPDGNSPLRFIVELDDISLDQFLSNDASQEITGWQVIVSPSLESPGAAARPAVILDLDEKISCDSRPAFLAETSLEEIQKQFGNHRVFDYQIANGMGEVQAAHSFYLNPYGEYLLSDTFADVSRLAGGIVGYPAVMGESKAVFPRTGQVITVVQPREGFYQFHYYAKSAIRWYSGLWTEETPGEIIIQFFLFRDDGIYDSENAFILPDGRKIQEPKNYDFEVSFTYDELINALGLGNAFYVRFLDKDGNIVGEDYLYFVSGTSPTP